MSHESHSYWMEPPSRRVVPLGHTSNPIQQRYITANILNERLSSHDSGRAMIIDLTLSDDEHTTDNRTARTQSRTAKRRRGTKSCTNKKIKESSASPCPARPALRGKQELCVVEGPQLVSGAAPSPQHTHRHSVCPARECFCLRGKKPRLTRFNLPNTKVWNKDFAHRRMDCGHHKFSVRPGRKNAKSCKHVRASPSPPPPLHALRPSPPRSLGGPCDWVQYHVP